MLSSLFIWENFAMTSTVRRITSTIKLNNARMNVSNARVSSRFIRYVRVAAPCICFVPWAALASCRPRPQQLLPVSAAGSGRRCCTLAILSGNFNIYICVLEMTAVISRTLFHGQGRNGQRHPFSYSRKYPDEKCRETICCICRSGPLP